MELLDIDWYIKPPIDLEHKQYVLYAFLKQVDTSFDKKVVSPYLLHMEKIVVDMRQFKGEYVTTKTGFNRYLWFENEKIEDNELVEIVSDIVEFSLPQIESRIFFGNKIFKKHKQILW